jgi:hypothetical protein
VTERATRRTFETMNEFTPFEELADELQARAKHREEETPGDPAAQAIAFAVARLRATITKAKDDDQWWTTARAAAECDCTVAAVQYWCRNATRLGLRVRQKPSREYEIQRDSVFRMKSAREERRVA